MADKAEVFKEAQRHLSRGQIEKAIELWKEYVKDNPDGNIYNTIGDLYLKSNRHPEAIEYFHKAADYFKEEGFITKAQALYKKILNIDPLEPSALLFIGNLNEEKGLVTDAIKYYLASIDANMKLGVKDELINITRKIIKLAPNNLPLRIKLAAYLQKEGFIEEAAGEYLNIGRLCEEKGEIDKAREFYEKSLEIFPRQEEIYSVVFDFYISQDLFDEARALLDKGRELFPGNLAIKLNYAELCLREGDLDRAKEVLLELVSAPGLDHALSVKASRMLGDVYLKEGNRELAWENYRPVVLDFLEKANYEDAGKLLEEFRDVAPLECSERLVEIYRRLGREEELFDELLNLADAQAAQGRLEDAYNTCNEARKIRSDSEALDARTAELEKKLGIAPVKKEEKTTAEKIIDADIFLRYGLLDEALDILERLKLEEPENVEVHERLKKIYIEKDDKEQAVTECLILARLHEKEGRLDQKAVELDEAFKIDPADPRLLELSRVEEGLGAASTMDLEGETLPVEGFDEVSEDAETSGEIEFPGTVEDTAAAGGVGPAGTVEAPPEVQGAEGAGGAAIEDFSDEVAEAEFYLRQGLYRDALSIYERLVKAFPDDESLSQRLAEARRGLESREEEAAVPEPDASVQQPQPEAEPPKTAAEEGVAEGAEDEMPEPSLDSEILEIFEEFKRGLTEEISEEDSETHYNLGIAYKEMGLIDDAIKEFQLARGDPDRKVQAASMLGTCYMEKKLYPLAITTFNDVLKELTVKDESYWGTKFDLAEAYERNNDLKRALDLYTEIYGWDSRFRNVDEKVDALKQKLAELEAGKNDRDSAKRRKNNRISYL